MSLQELARIKLSHRQGCSHLVLLLSSRTLFRMPNDKTTSSNNSPPLALIKEVLRLPKLNPNLPPIANLIKKPPPRSQWDLLEMRTSPILPCLRSSLSIQWETVSPWLSATAASWLRHLLPCSRGTHRSSLLMMSSTKTISRNLA